jgi:hypothetical protein
MSAAGSFASIALRTRVRLSPISDMSGGCQIRRDVPEAAIGPAIRMAGVSLAWCPRFFAFTAIRGKTWQEPRRKPPHQVPKGPGGAGLLCCGRNLHASHVP